MKTVVHMMNAALCTVKTKQSAPALERPAIWSLGDCDFSEL